MIEKETYDTMMHAMAFLKEELIILVRLMVHYYSNLIMQFVIEIFP
jgi:hypothetical protein